MFADSIFEAGGLHLIQQGRYLFIYFYIDLNPAGEIKTYTRYATRVIIIQIGYPWMVVQGIGLDCRPLLSRGARCRKCDSFNPLRMMCGAGSV